MPDNSKKEKNTKKRMKTLILVLLIFSAAEILFKGPENIRINREYEEELELENGDLEKEELAAEEEAEEELDPQASETLEQLLAEVPEYTDSPRFELSSFTFTDEDFERAEKKDHWEEYSELDSLGRCGTAYACLVRSMMPTEERGNIGSVKPTGWHTVKYDCVTSDDNTAGYLYNRCHLIAFCLAGENANKLNLITGTRYFNVTGMLPIEEEVAQYMDDHEDARVLYKVTPVFEGDNLVANGVMMEAYSLDTSEIRIHEYVYNVQPGVKIDYATGDSKEK